MRFGIGQSTLWADTTTLASNGSVNSMHDSYTPLGGLVPLANIATSEVIFGGVGTGMYGMVLYIILSVFIAGLMVGRTPEYLGKKIEAREMKAVMLALLSFALVLLGWAAVGAVNSFGTDTLNNAGPHGLSEILYAFTSRSGEQRLGLRRPGREHDVLQPRHRHLHARRPLPLHRPGDGDRGDDGGEEAGALRVPGRSRRTG